MARGADVIYQATFFDGTFRGHADFLLRVDAADRPSRCGPYHYEVADTKLARHVKASAVLQICSYVDQLERIQGVRPEWLHVALGGSARTVERLRVDDYMAYYRSARDRFLRDDDGRGGRRLPAGRDVSRTGRPLRRLPLGRRVRGPSPRRRPPEPGRRDLRAPAARTDGLAARRDARPLWAASRCRSSPRSREPARARWSASASRLGSSSRAGARAARGTSCSSRTRRPTSSLERGLACAAAAVTGRPLLRHRGRPVRASRTGSTTSSACWTADGTFHAIWSRDDDGEFTLAGEQPGLRAPDGLHHGERLAADPTMHVYHYAPYEPTALKRLMGRYGTREAEVDRLLRDGVLVDLLRAVRQSLRASVESYSIKKMEPFYGFVREIDLRDAGRASSPSSSGSSWAKANAPSASPRAHRGLQPRRRRQQPAAARLARGAAPRVARLDRPAGAAARSRASIPCPSS